jgi:hypothetical protein
MVAHKPDESQHGSQRHETVMPILRNADVAVIAPEKLTRYCLDMRSKRGHHKARVFKAALGFDLSNYVDLLKQLREGVMIHEARLVGKTDHGELWQVDMPVTGPAGTASVRTGWIYEEGNDVPRLTTAFVLGS